ncbi:(d)CMP kinase, partial [bacterium]
MPKIRVAIDGPAGAGKSTIARLLAERLGYIYIDTGAMYRALTLVSIEENIAPDDANALAARLGDLDIRLANGKTYIGHRNISTDIRAPEVDARVSEVCAHPEVRREMVKRQREMAAGGGVVMEGRDIGTVVLPDAELKIFLTASSRVRAERRAGQLRNAKIEYDIDALEKEIERRDRMDSTREDSPLKPAEDAVLIDNSKDSVEETIERVIKIARKRM